jgi:mediator of RNA polymerase II transcription subunit 16
MQDWIVGLIKILNISVDYSGEHTHEALLKNEHLRACLSVFISFGFKGEKQPRSFQSKHALMAVGLRNVAYTITVAISPSFNVGGKKSPLDDYGKLTILATVGRVRSY